MELSELQEHYLLSIRNAKLLFQLEDEHIDYIFKSDDNIAYFCRLVNMYYIMTNQDEKMIEFLDVFYSEMLGV